MQAPRAVAYRELNKVQELAGTAVNVQVRFRIRSVRVCAMTTTAPCAAMPA